MTSAVSPSGEAALRADLEIIASHIAPETRVLDVGCGDGALLAELRRRQNVDARGMEIDAESVQKCVARGLSVMQGDADHDLAQYPDKSFDYTILSQTLQTSARPDKMLDELLRVGRRAFVSFPNFAHWRTRAALLFGGKMPVTKALPMSWFETPNIHHVTIADFRELLAAKQVVVEDQWFFAGEQEIGASSANWRGEFAVFLLRGG
jgi:methionine biosynthesis protein MetW